jgi:hypothetical protein
MSSMAPKLSILLPTFRADLAALARVAEACSWAGPDVEVLVRDNSGDAEKRALLRGFRREHCNIISVDVCEPRENYSELLRLAGGEFVFCLGDDDIYFSRAVAALPSVIAGLAGTADVVGVTGSYLIESSKGSGIVGYANVDSGDVTARVAGYLGHSAANVMMYSPLRRAIVHRVFGFMASMPCSLSFHDQIACLLYLLNGRFVRLPKLIYGYDFGPWEDIHSAQSRDVAFYEAAGLDPAINKLHWFLCGFEGAILIRNGDVFPDHPRAERQKMADQWFSVMFQRFLVNPRLVFGSPLGLQADALCAKLRGSQGRLSFVDMLSDICHFIALFSDAKAQDYLRFWAAALTPRKAAASA